MDAEAVLLVDDDQTQILEGDSFLEQRMGADDDASLARLDAGEDLLARAALLTSREQFDANARRLAKLGKIGEVLPRQDFGRHHQCALCAALDRRGERQQAHHRLAGADVALQQPQHALADAMSRRISRVASACAAVRL